MNPEHLWLGTPKENQADMYKKGRDYHIGIKGEKNSKAKLSSEIVKEIRILYQGDHTQRSLARKFGVCKSTIGYITRQEHWRGI